MAGWRFWNATLHRDLGYLATGLTLVYALSGLAVNHMADWNPNYRRIQEARQIAPLDKTLPEEQLVRVAAERLQATEGLRNHFQPDEDTLQLFTKDLTYSLDLPTGKVLVEGNQPRPVLLAMNRLHLNAPKRAWTWIADAYALVLAFLALSGLFILRGPKGLAGRGKWLLSAGCALPLGYWIWWAYFV